MKNTLLMGVLKALSYLSHHRSLVKECREMHRGETGVEVLSFKVFHHYIWSILLLSIIIDSNDILMPKLPCDGDFTFEAGQQVFVVVGSQDLDRNRAPARRFKCAKHLTTTSPTNLTLQPVLANFFHSLHGPHS